MFGLQLHFYGDYGFHWVDYIHIQVFQTVWQYRLQTVSTETLDCKYISICLQYTGDNHSTIYDWLSKRTHRIDSPELLSQMKSTSPNLRTHACLQRIISNNLLLIWYQLIIINLRPKKLFILLF